MRQIREEMSSNNSNKSRRGTLCELRVHGDLDRSVSLQTSHLDDFKLTRSRDVTIGRASHKYLVEKYLDPEEKFAFDLNEGLDTFDTKPENEGLNAIERYLVKKAAPGATLKETINGAEFITWRGTITKLAVSPYEQNGVGWKFAVVKYQDVYFVYPMETQASIREQSKKTEQDKRFTYWGHKFETFIFADEGQDPTPNEPVSTWEEMCGVFNATFPACSDRFPEVKLFTAAEMDGLDSSGKHVEVKTQFKDLYVGRFFDQKALKWWVQSHAVGIEKLVVGLRSQDGIVTRCISVQLNELKRKCTSWNASICLRAAQRVFNAIRCVYDLEVKEGQLLIVERHPNERSATFKVVEDDGSIPVLLDEFKQRFAPKTSDSGTKETDSATDQVPSDPSANVRKRINDDQPDSAAEFKKNCV